MAVVVADVVDDEQKHRVLSDGGRGSCQTRKCRRGPCRQSGEEGAVVLRLGALGVVSEDRGCCQ